MADSTTPRTIVSACLAGIFCRYDGSTRANAKVVNLIRRGEALPVCPEQLGGLPTPRPPCERRGDRVLNSEGCDVTAPFARGAEEALRLARLAGCTRAVLQSRSPSCGLGRIHDGSFRGRLVDGNGVFAALLLENGFTVLTEDDL
ncbi:MAG: DUF523 domain-containing protein [Desulfovibrionaceae bacterium]|jgi:uncharacterized protein YbbK (DUF523 family)|nr:DUF523 domain-containing protein [Desulfovibrionaceae bacterium]